MIHTFEVYCTVGYNQAMNIRDDFGVSRARNRFSVKGKINGIAKISLFPQADRTGYTFMVEVNPAKLLYGYDAFETVTADDDTLERLSQAFYDALNELTDAADLPMLPDWFARRIDYAVDVRTAHINEYVKLLNKGDKPSAYTSRPKGEMGSCYWQCKSMTGNVYTKADQMAKSGKPQHLIERAKDILRVEVQCKSPKVGYLRRKKEMESRQLRHFVRREMAEEIISNYCKRVFKPGDYYTRAEAIVNIKGQIGEKKRRVTACENILQAVAQTRSISEARRQLEATGIAIKNSKSGKMLQYSKEQFSRNCRHLADLNINPVTIPRDWTINASVKCLPSITKLIQPLLSIGTEVPQEQIPNA